MRSTIRVIARELQEKKFVFFAALVAGTIPYLVLFRRTVTDDAVDAVAAGIAVTFAIAVAFIMGASSISSDLAERRASFYFSRPLPALAIWGGKTIAAVLLSFVSAVIAMIPLTLSGRGLVSLSSSFRTWTEPHIPALLLASIFFIIALGHAIAMAFRSRSRWAIAELVGAAVLLAIFWFGLRPFVEALALDLVRRVLITACVLLLVSLFVAAAVGLSQGRVEMARVYRVQALTFLGVSASLVIGFLLYVHMIRTGEIGDLEDVNIAAVAANGSTVAVSGRVAFGADFHQTFLLDPETGYSLQIPNARLVPLELSPDGTRAVWAQVELDGMSPRIGRLAFADLASASVRETTIKGSAAGEHALSADGRLVAVASGQLVAVYDLELDKALVSARIPDLPHAWAVDLQFVGPQLLRIYVRDRRGEAETRQTAIYELDINGRRLRRTGSFPSPRYSISDPSSRWLLAFHRSDRDTELDLHDASTGARIATLDFVDAPSGLQSRVGFPAASWISGDRVAVAHRDGPSAFLTLFRTDGMVDRTYPLGPAAVIRIGGEQQPGHLPLALANRAGSGWKEFSLHRLNLENGVLEPVESGVIPPFWITNKVAPGSVGTRLFFSPEGSLVYFDLATGDRRVLARQDQ